MGAELTDNVISARDYKPKPGILPSNFHWILFIPLLLLGAYLRHFGFFLPSSIGDPTAYQSLAMKLNYGFMEHYDIYYYRMTTRPDPGLVDYVWDEDPKVWNARRIRPIYHRPLHLQPPLFPILIWLSHGIFNHGEPYTSVTANRGWDVVRHPPWNYSRAQFYAILVPFLSSVGTLWLVYLFCLRFWSYREGLLATILLLASPVELAVGPKLYADGILTFFMVLSLYWYFRAMEAKDGKSLRFAVLAGVSLGLGYLTKVTGILFAFAWPCTNLLYPQSSSGFFRKLFEKRLLTASAVVLLTASPWLLLMHHHYGSFFVNTPPDPGNPWYHYVFGRPLRAYPLDLLWFVPPLALGWLYGLLACLHPRRHWKESVFLLTTLFYLGMFLLFVKTGSSGVEDRYLLPIYPLLAILTGCALVRGIEKLPHRWARTLGYSAATFLLAVSSWRSALIGLQHTFAGIVVFKPLGF